MCAQQKHPSKPVSNDLLVRNPHSILPALQKRPKDVLEITLPREKNDPTWNLIVSLAEKHKIKVKESSGFAIDYQSKNSRSPIGRESSHGAIIKPKVSLSVEEVFKGVNAESRGVWLALDCLQDPQNLECHFSFCCFFGVKGLIMTQERSVPMTQTVYDIASGGVECVPFANVINLQRAFEKAKDLGLWILGTSEHAKESLQNIKKDRPWLVVVGNEENGMRRLTEEACDMKCTIPGVGEGVTSLNVSVATGIVLSQLA